jgi:hypothetical protein
MVFKNKFEVYCCITSFWAHLWHNWEIKCYQHMFINNVVSTHVQLA